MPRRLPRLRLALALTIALATAAPPTALAAQPAPAAALTAEQWRADLRTMMEELPRRHRNLYHTTPRATFDSAARALDARIPTLARHEIILELARIVALAGDGHTNVYPTRDRAIGFHELPIALYPFADGWYVRAADAAHASLVGARVRRIGDATIDSAYARVRPYVGRDNEMGVRFFAAPLLAMPEVLHALRLAPSVDSARFELEIGGARRVVWLHAGGLAPLMAADTDRGWRPRDGWVDARDATPGPDPLWLRVAPDTTLWWLAPVAGTHTVYAQVNQVRNGVDATFGDFADRLLAYLDSTAADRLVLDLRLNRGGNGDLLQPLVRGLLRRPRINAPGGLLVLMGRSTWSAAQFLLNDLQEFSDATFVGEPSGSKGNAYGDSRQIRLPNSGVTVRASVYYWQDWSPDDTRQWTAPDVSVEPTFADYRAKRDPVLAAALAYVAPVPLAVVVRTALAADDTAAARAAVRAFRADVTHRYADVLRALDAAALHFYGRRDLRRATWAFALAADEYPDVVQAQLDLAAMHQESAQPALERRALARVLALDPANESATARLRALGSP